MVGRSTLHFALCAFAALICSGQAQAVDTYSTMIMADSPAVYYRLDELSNGACVDATGNSTATANASAMGVPGALVGLSSTAARFTASPSTGVVSGDAIQAFAPDLGPMSVELWARPSGEGNLISWPRIAKNQYAATAGLNIYMVPGSLYAVASPYSAGTGTLIQTPFTPDSAWHHIAFVLNRDLDRLELYVDGALASFGNFAENWALDYDALSPSLYIGRDRSGSSTNTDIDEVAIYKSALTLAQVQAHYLAGSRALTVSSTSDSGTGSLRSAITTANRLPGAQTIDFALPVAGPTGIDLTSTLPPITEQVFIDGATQPGYAGTPAVDIVGPGNSAPAMPIVSGSGTRVRGLAFGNNLAGIESLPAASGTQIDGCYFGVSHLGTVLACQTAVSAAGPGTIVGVTGPNGGNSFANCNTAIEISGASSEGASIQNNAIGALTFSSASTNPGIGVSLADTKGAQVSGNRLAVQAAGINVINTSYTAGGHHTISGNRLGSNAADTAGVSMIMGLYLVGSNDNTLGGPHAADGNTIGSCIANAIMLVQSSRNTIDCNRIGTDSTGTVARQVGAGVAIYASSSQNTIGSMTAERPNLIANAGYGVFANDATCQGNRIENNQIRNVSTAFIDLNYNGPTANDANDYDTGANRLQNYPVLTAAGASGDQLTLTGTMDSATDASDYPITVTVYSQNAASGIDQVLGQVSVAAPGSFIGTLNATVSAGTSLVAVATDAAGNTSELSSSVTCSGPTTHLAFAAQPADTVAGTTMSAVTVECLDAQNHRTVAPTGTINLALTPAGGPALSGTLAVAPVAGLATFNTLSMTTAGTGYRLGTYANSLTGATSNTFSILAGAADGTATTIATDKTSAAADDTEQATLTVTAVDRYGNPVAGVPAGQLLVGAAPATGVTVTQPAAATNAAGQVTAKAKSSAVGTITFTPQLNAQASTHTTTVRYLPGDPAALHSTMTADKATATADGVDTVTFTITVRDLHQRPVPGASASLLQVQGSPSDGVTVVQATAATNDAGQTTATATCTKAGVVTFGLLVGGQTSSAAPQVTFAAGPAVAAHSSIEVDRTTASATGIDPVNVLVTLRDVYGNLVQGVAPSRVVLAASPTDGVTLRQPDYPSSSAGRTGGVVLSTKAGRIGLTAKLDGVALPSGTAVDFAAGEPNAGVCLLSVSPATRRANGADVAVVTVTLLDGYLNPVPNVAANSVVVNSNAASGVNITQPTGTSSATGTLTASVTSTKAGTITFGATVNGQPVVATAAATFTPGAPDAARSTLRASRSSLAADGIDSTQLILAVRDAYDNPVPGVAASTIALTTMPPTGVTVTAPTAATDSNGETFGSLRGTRVGTITVTASVAGVTLEQSIQVGFVPGGIDADSSGVVASVDQTAADGASPVMLTITVKDAGGNPVPAVSSSRLRVVAEPSTGISITQPSAATDGSGQTTASALSSQIGTVTFRATIDGAVLGTTDTVTFVAGDPVASTSVLAADRSLAASDGSENVLLTLTVRDAQGHPVAGVASTRAGFVATPSTGVTLTPAAATTDATGRLTATASCSQAQTVTFGSTLDGATTAGAPQVVFAPHRPDAAHCLLTADTTSAVADGADRVTFTLTVRDDQDRPVAGVAADRLRLTATPLAGLTLTQPTQPTDVSGATTAVLVGTVAGSYACGLTLDGADTEQSVTVTLHPGAVLPSNCRLAADKTAAASDGADTVTLTATLRDALGNPVAGVATGRLALVVNPSSGVQVTGPSRVSDAAGQTTFTVTSSAIANVVCALRVDGLDTAQSVTVAFSTAPPGVDRTRSTLVADRSSAVADGVDTITFTATLRDAQGDPVAGVTADRLALAVDIAGGVTIVGFGASDANGQVTATARSTSLGSRSFTLQVDSQAAATPVAISFTAGAPTADQSTLQASRTSAVANGVDTVALTLTLKDAHGNSVAGVAASEVVLTAEGGLGSGLTLSQPSAASDASGRMTMSVRATAAQAVTLRATLGDLSWTVGITFSEPQPAAGRSTVSISPATIAADGAAETVLTVTLADASGTAIVGSQPADRSVQSSALVVAVASAGEPSDSHGRFQMRLTSRQVGTTQLTVVANGVRLAAVTLTVTGYADVQLAAGLHFVGLPLTPSAESYQSLLGLSGVDAARFDAGTQSYASVGSSYTPGQGLWVRTTAAVSQRLVGTPTPDQPCRLTLRRGWNALANPFARALDWDLASISVEYNGVSLGHLDDTLLWSRLAPYAWVYQSGSGYRLLADTSLPAFASAQGSLPVGSGFWLHAVDDGLTLVLPPPSASRQARKAASPASGDWSVALQASQGGTDVAVQVGMTGAMPSGLRLAMPPTAIGQSAPRLSLLAADGSRLAGDLRGSGQQASWQLELVSASADEVVLTWPGLGRGLPRGLVLSVADLTTGTTTLLNTRAAWRWQPSAAGEVRRLTLTARPGHLARAGIAALELSATRGSAAAISLTLTAPAEVTVQVRGLGGRLVRELSQACEAGTSVLNWDGLDQSGRPVPAGSYRLEAQATSADGAVQKALRTVTIGR